jgi:nucleotidyltransferase substrate binding protein (TIGR01987 family)
MPTDIRWQQRFANFDRAVVLLHEPVARGVDTLSALEQEGTIQRFEVALELAWKTLKDFLDYQGQVVEPATPRHVIKAAFAAHVLRDGQVWIDMIDHRNLLSHSYDPQVFHEAVLAIRDRYLPAFDALQSWFSERIVR